MYTVFGIENLGYVYCHVSCLIGFMFDAMKWRGPRGEAPRESSKVWGAAGLPIPFREVKKKQKMGQAKLEVEKHKNGRPKVGWTY